MKKLHLISPLYLLSILNSATSQRDMYAGFWINFENQKNCTASFLVNKQGINGLLTSARCCVNNNCLNGNTFDTAYENEDDGNVTKIGQVHDSQFGGANGLDYAFITLDSVDWKPFIYTVGLTGNDTFNNGTITELYPVTSDFTPTEPGLTVCASGQSGGYLCGNLTELDLTLAVANPWNGSPTVLKGVNKVDLGTTGFASEEDLGGPVYVQTNSSGTTTAQALGHIVATNNDDPNHKVLYYMPIDKILGAKNTKLLTHAFEEENLDEIEIKHVEWNKNWDLNAVDSEKITYVFAGEKIIVGGIASCTINYAVSKGGGSLNGGLTAGHCLTSRDKRVFLEKDLNKPIGYIDYVVFKSDNDFAFINNLYTSAKMAPCIVYPEGGKLNYLAVTGTTVPFIGEEVCFVGYKSGYVCGTVEAYDVTTKFEEDDNIRTGLVKVNLGWFSSGTGGDSGGPVFIRNTEEKNGIDTTAQAVGSLVGGGRERWFKNYFYYYPLSAIFSKRAFEVVTTNTVETCLSLANALANVTKNQQTQIEIPPKK